jgi:eukaryotic-like serine/threonine-protein kinase
MGPDSQTTPAPAPAAADGPDLTGRTLGDFRVLRRLGQGGMGQVYLAEQVSLKRKVALKILRPDLAEHPANLQRFKLEAEAVARATHANIVQVYATGEADGVTYMALEYVEGRNLREYLAKKGPPDLLLALSIMRQVASALQRAGELGMVHRDIKPENILLTRKGEVKVADFGLSRCLVGDGPALNLTQSGVTMGTPLYMSPEQVEGKPVDPRSDVYSFGVTCYHMLAGQPPFRGETAFEVALQHVRAEPAPLAALRPDLPPALCAVVHKMMAKAPEARYQTGRELLRDVVRVRESLSGATAALSPTSAGATVASAALTAPPAGAPSTAVVPTARHLWRRPALWFVLSVLLAVLAGAAFAWQRRHAADPLRRAAANPPADASEVEALAPAQRREKALREAAEEYLNAPAGKNVAVGFGLCLDLGLLYLEADRLDDADRLFTRLDGIRQPPVYHLLGHTGRAVVLALRDRPDESNRMFLAVFGSPRFTVPVQNKAGPRRLENLAKQDPAFQMLVNPQWRFWMNKALSYNARNGLPEEKVPAVLQKLLPLKK